MNAIFILSLHILALFEVTSGKNIFVSSISGTDAQGCGNDDENFCKTINYAYTSIAEEDDNIILDGGLQQQATYPSDATLVLNRSISFGKYSNSSFKPLVLGPIKSGPTHYAFSFDVSRNSTFSFDSIDFANVSIFRQNDEIGDIVSNLKFRNCTGTQRGLNNYFIEIKGRSNVDINNCRFIGQYYHVLRMEGKGAKHIEINYTYSSGGLLFVTDLFGQSTANIDNVVLVKGGRVPSVIFRFDMRKVSITNSRFSDASSPQNLFEIDSKCHNSTSIGEDQLLIIHNVTFENINAGQILNIQCRVLDIESLTINKATLNGAPFNIWRSKGSIKKVAANNIFSWREALFWLQSSYVDVNNVSFQHNTILSFIHVSGGSATVSDATIHNNTRLEKLINVQEKGVLALRNAMISNNEDSKFQDEKDSFITVDNSNMTLLDVDITGNRYTSCLVTKKSFITLRKVSITNNTYSASTKPEQILEIDVRGVNSSMEGYNLIMVNVSIETTDSPNIVDAFTATKLTMSNHSQQFENVNVRLSKNQLACAALDINGNSSETVESYMNIKCPNDTTQSHKSYIESYSSTSFRRRVSCLKCLYVPPPTTISTSTVPSSASFSISSEYLIALTIAFLMIVQNIF